MSLKEYVRKRDFALTQEPRGKIAAKLRSSASTFVIQKHDASRLHYDFRLEIGGTLKSWAVPKGVPFRKGDKRLAVQTEDHPLEYARFEGVIPKGQYGGGTVMVWDHGTFDSLSGDALKSVTEGKLHFVLHGGKLEGEWTLVRIKGDAENQWLLLKSGEDVKAVTKKRDDESILTGRSLAQIAADRDAEWHSDEKEPAAALVQKLAFFEPMKAKLVAEPPADGRWIYELKFDGFRALALKTGREVDLLSRNAKDLKKRFPEIAAALAALPVKSAIFDGEVVALDAEGRPSFQLLQGQESSASPAPLAYYVFDLLHEDGRDLRSEPLEIRRERLEKLLSRAGEPLRFSGGLGSDPRPLLQEVKAHGLEGIIGKQLGSTYEVGRRSGAWIKIKCLNEQEFVIGGFTPPEGTRKHFGALLVGFFEKGKLRFAGKVGTGFSAAVLKAVHTKLRACSRETCPFSDLPQKQQGRWSQNITPREMKLCHWAEPQLVCQVRFTEWTDDGKLRHPVFLGLREDKDAREVARETASV
ncbi:MAG TPA: non-homologous end-joining DNA ligase [Chthoniobacteraceae bacterium]|jgi:bifunctional non-homologous end joining protein LigD